MRLHGAISQKAVIFIATHLYYWLTNLDANFHAEGILKLVSRCDKCLNLFGDYVDKYVKNKLYFGLCIQKIRMKFSFIFSSVPYFWNFPRTDI
jgi:hypothetical protein